MSYSVLNNTNLKKGLKSIITSTLTQNHKTTQQLPLIYTLLCYNNKLTKIAHTKWKVTFLL